MVKTSQSIGFGNDEDDPCEEIDAQIDGKTPVAESVLKVPKFPALENEIEIYNYTI